MNAQDFIAIGLAAGAFAFVARALYRQITRGGCGTGACGCSHSKDASQSADESRSIKRVPLITLDQVGRPASTSANSGANENS